MTKFPISGGTEQENNDNNLSQAGTAIVRIIFSEYIVSNCSVHKNLMAFRLGANNHVSNWEIKPQPAVSFYDKYAHNM